MLDSNFLQRSLKGAFKILWVSRQMLVNQPDQRQADFFRIIATAERGLIGVRATEEFHGALILS